MVIFDIMIFDIELLVRWVFIVGISRMFSLRVVFRLVVVIVVWCWRFVIMFCFFFVVGNLVV